MHNQILSFIQDTQVRPDDPIIPTLVIVGLILIAVGAILAATNKKK